VTIREVLARSSEYLGRRGVESPRLDAERLLAKALGLSRIELYTEHDRPLTEPELTAARALVERRGLREPLAYVLGEWGFRRLTLATDARALVPRPETEMLVERALALLAGVARPRVLDVGTGTGAIALALADEHPGAHLVAVDASAGALALAAENVTRSSLGARVRLERVDVLAEPLPPGPFDLVVSNPTYVPEDDLRGLQAEVREWEPRLALVASGALEAVAEKARAVLEPGGALVLEVGDGQADGVAAQLRSLGYEPVTVSDDLTGRQRVVDGRWA